MSSHRNIAANEMICDVCVLCVMVCYDKLMHFLSVDGEPADG